MTQRQAMKILAAAKDLSVEEMVLLHTTMRDLDGFPETSSWTFMTPEGDWTVNDYGEVTVAV